MTFKRETCCLRNNVIIFGTAHNGIQAYNYLTLTYNILFYCDNDQKKWGTEMNGVRVLPPSELINFKEYKVIITSANYDQIAAQLFDLGIYKFEIFDRQYYTENWETPKKFQCKPQFLGIGAQKAGTTWLYENLRMHPELYLPVPKELHYFDQQISHNLNYWGFFESDKKINGEITPAYSVLSYERIKYIYRILPNVKIILILRNPIERAWSQIMMTFVKKQNRPIEEVKEEEILHFMKLYNCINRSNYIQIMENWKDVFPENQIFIGMYEDIKNNPKIFLNNIFRFLGVSEESNFEKYPYGKKIFDGGYVEIPNKYKKALDDLYASFLAELKKVGFIFP